MRTFIAFLLLFILNVALGQTIPRQRLTFSGGWSEQVGGGSYVERQTALGLGLSYGFRFHKHVEAETGLFTALQPAPDIRGANYFVDPDDRFLWVPFGVRLIAPLYQGRIELSAGGGGLYEKYSVSNPDSAFGLVPRDGWGGYLLGSAAVALDPHKHFWLSGTPRWFLANPQYARDRWFQISGEFSVRF